MLSYFPTPLEDELLYSVLARYACDRSFKTSHAQRSILLGRPSLFITYDLPRRINYLTSILPPGCSHTADGFINLNTMFPFYSASLAPERVIAARQSMREEITRSTHRTWIKQFSSERISFLRYCPICFQEDVERHGFAFWHRSHHFPALDICTIHQVWLEDSEVSIRATKQEFVAAEAAIPMVCDARPLDLTDRDVAALLTLAKDAVWVLHKENLYIGAQIIRERYFNLLQVEESEFSKGVKWYYRNRPTLYDSYGEVVFDKLGLKLGNPPGRDWLRWLSEFERSASHQSLSTIIHLLILRFLGLSPANFSD